MSFPVPERQGKDRILSGQVLEALPKKLVRHLASIAARRQTPIFFSGGVVRDWLLGLVPVDIDITIASGALPFAKELATALGAAFVPLSPEEGVARVVWGETCLDISQFREGTTTIEDDLRRRDFSVNALAVGLDRQQQGLADGGLVLDPLGGLADLGRGRIRLTHAGAFDADPLRMLRAYRFRAVFDWKIEADTERAIALHSALIEQVSGERIAAELDKILACAQCQASILEMAGSGLLLALFPELAPGIGLLQPSSHHLDVFDHSLETLRQMERIISQPQDFFGSQRTPQGAVELDPALGQDLRAYLSAPRQAIRLKYAALFHDLGKTTTGVEKDGRMTFYNHDAAGVVLLEGVADRLRWSNEDARRIGQLVQQHMWPFHLHNAKVRTGITPKAILKLVRAAGDELIGLFSLAMADSLAGQGPGKPEGMEGAVAALFAEVYHTYLERLKPILETPLLSGRDLIQTLRLSPGPLFRQILDGLLEERAAAPEMTKAQALAWAKDYAAGQSKGGAARLNGQNFKDRS